jgi:hypothetical protein
MNALSCSTENFMKNWQKKFWRKKKKRVEHLKNNQILYFIAGSKEMAFFQRIFEP